MKFALDHLVHAVLTPEEAAKTFEDTYQWRTVKGGEHRNWGTYNSLAYFGLSYVEWIGIRDNQIAKGSRFGSQITQSLARGEGVVQLALRTEDMDEVVRMWQERGIPFTGPENSSRVRPDGETIRWRLLYPDVKDEAEIGTSYVLPFVIEWGKPDATRSLEFEELRAAQGRCVGVHAVVNSLESIERQFQAYFGALQTARYDDEDYCRLEISLSGTTLYFWKPRAKASSSVAMEWLEFLSQIGDRTVQLDIADVGQDELHPAVGSKEAGLRLRSPRESLHGLIANIKRE